MSAEKYPRCVLLKPNSQPQALLFNAKDEETGQGNLLGARRETEGGVFDRSAHIRFTWSCALVKLLRRVCCVANTFTPRYPARKAASRPGFPLHCHGNAEHYRGGRLLGEEGCTGSSSIDHDREVAAETKPRPRGEPVCLLV
ncbi:hypothetical protein DPEC_G00327170 [Dallia pectoralis]|uniref:Uncharacterized protein n=1 Tax=Dallia pectoralis TaxID=75939 RepID=A0ACC2F7Y3_DALPE|nr:hypothetical protein DPEC_G00327170 [Dallia pectoralis]